jgi:hypothetical protein
MSEGEPVKHTEWILLFHLFKGDKFQSVDMIFLRVKPGKEYLCFSLLANNVVLHAPSNKGWENVLKQLKEGVEEKNYETLALILDGRRTSPHSEYRLMSIVRTN